MNARRQCASCGSTAKTERVALQWLRGEAVQCHRCWNSFMATPPASRKRPRCPGCGKSGHVTECPRCVEAGVVATPLFDVWGDT